MIEKITKFFSQERYSDPLHLLVLSYFVDLFGNTRQKIAWDLVGKKPYAYCIQESAELARSLGLKSISIIELGVAFGGGLMNMVEIAKRVSEETSVEIKVYGFDTGQGLTKPIDFRDHPNLYKEGDFPMNFEELSNALPENARLIIGDVKETIKAFISELPSEEPIGFISVDLDYYSSTKNALEILSAKPENYLPYVHMYFDDISLDWHNQWSGQLLAINEFNQKEELRKISKHEFLRHSRIFKHRKWIDHIYLGHILDHAVRNEIRKSSKKCTIENPYLKFDGNTTDFT